VAVVGARQAVDPARPQRQGVAQQNLNVAEALPEGASELTVPAVQLDGSHEVPIAPRLCSRASFSGSVRSGAKPAPSGSELLPRVGALAAF
jgi:hypothetical protein